VPGTALESLTYLNIVLKLESICVRKEFPFTLSMGFFQFSYEEVFLM
jgi:hypothetical protein